MTKFKFIKRALCAFLAASMMLSFAGCKNKENNSKTTNNTNEAKQIVNYFVPSEFEMPENSSYVSDIFYANDKIYLCGQKDGGTSEKLIQKVDIGTKEAVDVDLSSIEFEYIMDTKMAGDKLYVVYNDTDYNLRLCVFDMAEGKVLAQTEPMLNSYISSMNVDGNGNLVAISTNYTMAKQEMKMITYNGSTLDVISETNISEKLELSDREGMSGIIYQDDGSIAVVVVNYSEEEEGTARLIKLDTDFNVEYVSEDFSDMEGYNSGGFKLSNGNICLISSKNYKKYYINEVDIATGSVVNRYEAELDEESFIMGGYLEIEGYDFVYKSMNGIYGYILSEGKSEPILKFGADISQDFENCYSISCSGNSMLLYAEVYGDEGGETISVYDMEGNPAGEIPITASEKEAYVQKATVTPEGKIVIAENINKLVEGEEGEEDDDEETYVSIYNIRILDSDGNEEKSFPIDTDKLKDSYLQDMAVGSNGDLYMIFQCWAENEGYCVIMVYDADGNMKAELNDKENIEYANSIIPTSDGDYVMYYSKDSKRGNLISKIDYENNTLGEEADWDISQNPRIIRGNDKYDFCYMTGEGVYGFSISDKRSDEIVNWIDSDINGNIDNVAIAGSDKLITTMHDYDTGEMKISVLDRADEETLKKIQNKQIVTVAGLGVTYGDVFDSILEFNKNSNEYRIQLNDYEKYSSYEDNQYHSGAAKLNSDIASGNIPDILIGNYEIDMSSYAAKGLLTDLYPFIDKDEDISKEDYMENIFDVYSYDGKLCQLVTDFTLNTLVGKSSVIGKENGWTFEDFFEFADGKSPIFYEPERSDLMNMFIKENLSEFVDFKEKKCDFNNDNFVKLLEFIKKEAVEKSDEDNEWNEEKWKEQIGRFKNNKCQLERMNMYGFSNLLDLQQGAIGEEVSIVGVPAKEKNGNLISATTTIGITEKSKNKDAAWSFIREFLTEEYQDGMNEDYIRTFPIMKSSFEKTLKKAQNAETYKNYSVETPDGEYKAMQPLDAQTAEKIKNIISSANRAVTSDTRINDIIDEQADIFFEGGQSAQEAAEAIQSKASLYLKEIK